MDNFIEIPDSGSTTTMSSTMRPADERHGGFNAFRFRSGTDDTNGAPVLLGLGAALMLFSIALIAARLWSRARPMWKLRADDWTILAGLILAIAQYGIICASVLYGLGRRARFVSLARRRTSLHLLFVSQTFWYWSLTLIKLSVALLLLRLKHTKRWRIFLATIICIIISAAILQTVFQFAQCRPFSVYWDPRISNAQKKGGAHKVTCFKTSVINGNIVAFSSLQIVLDIVFSFIPMTFIRKLHVPRREKVFMCVLMGLGVFASVAAIVRTLVLQANYRSDDVFRTNVGVALWALIEQHFAIIAATMPTLKNFMELALVRISLFFYDKESEEGARAKLVAMGLLNKDDVLERDEEVQIGRKPSRAESELSVGISSRKKLAEGWDGEGDSTFASVGREKEGGLSFEEMMLGGHGGKVSKAKEFV